MVNSELLTILRNEGYRITPQRVAIIDYILDTKSQPTAEDIHKSIQKTYPMTSLSTVYKTIELLKKKNLIRETGISEKTRFDTVIPQSINMICTNCGRIETLKDSLIKDLETKVKRKSHFEIHSQRIEFTGLCNRCKSK